MGQKDPEKIGQGQIPVRYGWNGTGISGSFRQNWQLTKQNCTTKIAPEGFGIIKWSAAILALTGLSLALSKRKALWLIFVPVVLWFISVIRFFRDPERVTPEGENLIIAPADGLVIAAGPTSVTPLEQSGQRVSIYMNALDVHVNRSPINGTITDITHIPGKFLSAFKPGAELQNEHNVVQVNTKWGNVAFSQVAGVLVRRIIFHGKKGWKLATGQRIGVICFGSQMNVYLPDNVKLFVRVGDRVTAGESVIGEFLDED